MTTTTWIIGCTRAPACGLLLVASLAGAEAGPAPVNGSSAVLPPSGTRPGLPVSPLRVDGPLRWLRDPGL